MDNFKRCRLIWSEKRCYIENYESISKMTKEKITTKHYIVEGEKLKIVKMDAFILEIEGIIKIITYGG